MSTQKTCAWALMRRAAKEAQDFLEANHCAVATGAWDSDDAMQVYENLECAALDIEDAGLDADALPDLLAACEAVLGWLRSPPEMRDLAGGPGGENAARLLEGAVARARGE